MRHILIERAAGTPNSSAPPWQVLGGWFTAAKPSSEEVGKSAAAQKFRDYFEFSEPLDKMPHRVLAVMRGEKEQILAVNLDGGGDGSTKS